MKTLKILLLEDNKSNRDTFTKTLEGLGHDVTGCVGLFEAAYKIKTNPFEVLLLDDAIVFQALQTENMVGQELAYAYKVSSELPDIPLPEYPTVEETRGAVADLVKQENYRGHYLAQQVRKGALLHGGTGHRVPIISIAGANQMRDVANAHVEKDANALVQYLKLCFRR